MFSEVAKALGPTFFQSFKGIQKKLLTYDASSPYFIKIPKIKNYPQNEVTDTLAQAIEENKKVILTYKKDGKIENYDASPLKISNFEGFWYLICLNRSGSFRKPRLEKFISCEITDKTFETPKNLDEYLQESTNIWADLDKKMKIVIKVSPEVAIYFKNKEIFPKQKILKEWKDGSLTVEGYVSKEEEAIYTIKQWVPYITISQPKSLKVKISKILHKAISSI